MGKEEDKTVTARHARDTAAGPPAAQHVLCRPQRARTVSTFAYSFSLLDPGFFCTRVHRVRIRGTSRAAAHAVRRLFDAGLAATEPTQRSNSQSSWRPPEGLYPASASADFLLTSHAQSQNRQVGLPHPEPQSHRTVPCRAKISIGPESVRSASNNSNNSCTTSFSPFKSSPRRPLLASLFRLGQNKSTASATDQSIADKPLKVQRCGTGSGHSRGTTDDEEYSDWDGMESASDVHVVAQALGQTADGMKTLLERTLNHSCSRSSGSSTPPKRPSGNRPTTRTPHRLCARRGSGYRRNRPRCKEPVVLPSSCSSQSRPSSRGRNGPNSASVHSAPPPASMKGELGHPVLDMVALPDPKLAMTRENIKPLLENARAVTPRLKNCISEMKGVLEIS